MGAKAESQAGQDPGGRNQSRGLRNTTYGLVLHGSLNLGFLSDHLPGGDTVQSGLDPLTSIISQENALRICLQASLMEALPHRGSLLPDHCSLW